MAPNGVASTATTDNQSASGASARNAARRRAPTPPPQPRIVRRRTAPPDRGMANRNPVSAHRLLPARQVRQGRGRPQPRADGDWPGHLWEDQLGGFETELRRNIGIAELVVQQLNVDIMEIAAEFPPIDDFAFVATAFAAAAADDDDINVDPLDLEMLETVEDAGHQIRYLQRALTNIRFLADRLLFFTEELGNRQRVNRALA